MSNLYGVKMAKVYDEIYQGFIDYSAEYDLYSTICKKYNASKILEIACGTGNLAGSFSVDFGTYTGMDYSDAMLQIAKEKQAELNFFQGDMRNFSASQRFDAILITGRSTSYLLTDDDFLQTLKCVQATLEENGVLIFDFIDAERFLPYVASNRYVKHKSTVKERRYLRESEWVIKKESNESLINWTANYYQLLQKDKIFLGSDSTLFRSFYFEALECLLTKLGFIINEKIDRKTYAFDTYLLVCTLK
ncbi:class I SAM-dependent DNA methyltransferase [Maribacter aestuarii]|uniref:class I SAM-dependent DNA methyltransferase n=1 Tax=Maribacter aestuarii TaxID=1130723 RepID=UPI00248B231B|nr:class I SAM-dependent methyltransferase [Maribacter aestuarii]